MKNDTRGNRSRKDPVAVRPVFVSQHTAPAVLGFKNERAFLEWIAVAGILVVARGKDRLVRLDDAEAALVRMASSPSSESPPGTEDATVTVSSILRSVGYRQRAGGTR